MRQDEIQTIFEEHKDVWWTPCPNAPEDLFPGSEFVGPYGKGRNDIYATCSCGAISPVLDGNDYEATDNWHDSHLAKVLSQQIRRNQT